MVIVIWFLAKRRNRVCHGVPINFCIFTAPTIHVAHYHLIASEHLVSTNCGRFDRMDEFMWTIPRILKIYCLRNLYFHQFSVAA